MRAFLGFIMIVVGMFVGASVASAYFTAEFRFVNQQQRFSNALGGAICSLFVVGTGIYLALSRGTKR